MSCGLDEGDALADFLRPRAAEVAAAGDHEAVGVAKDMDDFFRDALRELGCSDSIHVVSHARPGGIP
jgi:hypothetical protein